MISKNLKKGMTLTEIIIATAIFGVIAVALGNFGSSIFTFNSNAQSNLSAQSGGRRLLKTMVAELRSMSPSSLGAYPVAQASNSSITFFSDLDDDALKERIRYFLQGKTLMRGVIKPVGNPLTYNPANENLEQLVTDVVNGATPIFEYFDQNYTGESAALLEPIQVTNVRLVRITLLLDKDQRETGQGPIMVTSQVTLRNLKDNL